MGTAFAALAIATEATNLLRGQEIDELAGAMHDRGLDLVASPAGRLAMIESAA